jgi:8-oxo-dGTP pyrophosphatase MutT (NUDIX family)
MINTVKSFVRIFFGALFRIIPSDAFSDYFPVSVKALIERDGYFLFLLNERNEWDLPGGKIKLHEELDSALVREVFEETSLKVSDPLLSTVYIQPISPKLSVLVLVYKVTLDSPNVDVGISFEHFGFKWFKQNEIASISTSLALKSALLQSSFHV